MTGPERYYEAPRNRDIPEIYRPPLPAFLTGLLIQFVRDPMIAAALLQAAAATLLAWAVWEIAFIISGYSVAGWIAVFLVSFHPLILTFSLRFSSELLFILFLAMFLLSWLKRKDGNPGRGNFIAMGIAGGLACGVRPTALLLLPAFAVWIIFRYAVRPFFRDIPRPDISVMLRGYLFFAASFLLVLAPMSIRNHIENGIWTPVGCLGGFNLFVGNNRDNAAAYRAPDGASFLHHQNRGWDRAIKFAKSMPMNFPPSEQDRRFREETFKEIREMGFPEFFRMTAAKAWHFIRPWPLVGAHSKSVFFIICISELLLFAAGIAGVFLLQKNRELLLFLLMILFTGWSAHAFVHLQMRHRIPFLDFPLILTASVFLCLVWKSFFRKQDHEAVFCSNDNTEASSDIEK